MSSSSMCLFTFFHTLGFSKMVQLLHALEDREQLCCQLRFCFAEIEEVILTQLWLETCWAVDLIKQFHIIVEGKLPGAQRFQQDLLDVLTELELCVRILFGSLSIIYGPSCL